MVHSVIVTHLKVSLMVLVLHSTKIMDLRMFRIVHLWIHRLIVEHGTVSLVLIIVVHVVSICHLGTSLVKVRASQTSDKALVPDHHLMEVVKFVDALSIKH